MIARMMRPAVNTTTALITKRSLSTRMNEMCSLQTFDARVAPRARYAAHAKRHWRATRSRNNEKTTAAVTAAQKKHSAKWIRIAVVFRELASEKIRRYPEKGTTRSGVPDSNPLDPHQIRSKICQPR